MIEGARYVHTNLVARDWRTLAAFYQSVFGCALVPPERGYAGAALEAGTGLAGAALTGVHLSLTGQGEAGSTLEIYTYSRLADGPAAVVNRPGLGHLAFEVHSVEEARRRQVPAAGGAPVGEIVTLTTATGARVTWCYVTDPEGNILELQAWS